MLKNSLEHCIELDDGNDEEATTSTITNSCKISPANITNDTNVITTVHTKIGQAPSNHLTSQSTLISTTPATTLFNESVLLDEDYDEVLMESLDTLQSETRLSGHSDVSASASASTSMTGTAKAMQDNTLTQQQQKQEVKVAGPQQQQQRRLSLQEQKLLRQQNPVEKVFPHVATTHQKLRLLMSRSVNNTLQQQLLKAISAYIVGCRHEYEESTSSPYKCRRLAHSMTRTLDLIQQMCASFEDTPEYIHRMIELIAIYLSCELRYAKEFKEHKPLIANRILHNIYKNLKGANSEERLSYIFRMFAHTPRLYREREVMTKIFQCLIPKPTTCPILQRELPDKLYIQYIIVFYHWKQLELNQEEQIRVIEFANQLIRPAKSLCTNSIYAHNLPKYSSTQTATKFILHDLKFFHDLRNASIYDHRLQVCTEVIDISSDEEQSTTPKPSVDINFAELVENAEILPITRPMVKLENQIVIATIDLTLEDKQENEMEWLQELQRNAKKLEPTSNGLSLLAGQNSDLANSSSAGSEVIEIDSDSAGEEENDEVDEPENLLLEEPERLTNDFADFEEPDQDDQDLLENNLEEKKSISTKSQNKVDVMNSLAIKELSKDEVSSLPLSQQLTQVYPTKLNIISVRSIGATQTDEKSVGTQIQLENTITPEKLPAKSHSTGMYSIASTQTEESFCESTFEKNANANQLLPSKPTIIEVRSIAKNKSDNYTSTQLDTTTSERAKTQVNPEISKTLNAELVNRPGKQVMASVRNDYPLSNVEDSFSCRRDSLHLYSSPVRAIGSNNDASDKVTPDVDSNDVESEDEEDEDEDNDEMCFFGDNSTKSKTNSKSVADSDEFNSNRVIYSVAASTCPPLQQDSTDFMSDDDMTNFKPQIPVRTAGQKKLVKFSNKPLQRTAGKPITHPIKPAIKNTSNSTYNIIQRQSTPTINSIVSRFGSASPASSTSSLPRTLSKGTQENLNSNLIVESKTDTDNSLISTQPTSNSIELSFNEKNFESDETDQNDTKMSVLDNDAIVTNANEVVSNNIDYDNTNDINSNSLVTDNQLVEKIGQESLTLTQAVDISSTNFNELSVTSSCDALCVAVSQEVSTTNIETSAAIDVVVNSENFADGQLENTKETKEITLNIADEISTVVETVTDATTATTTTSINWQEEEDKSNYYDLEEFLILHKRPESQDNDNIVNQTNTGCSAIAINNTNGISTNECELDSDLEFDFDFVFGLDFDTMASTTAATVVAAPINAPVVAQITTTSKYGDSYNVEANKLLQQFNVNTEQIGATSLEGNALPEPPISSPTLTSTCSGCNLSSFSPKGQTLTISSTASTTSSSPQSLCSGNKTDEIQNGETNVELPLELENELLMNADDDLLPSTELITDAELLKEFVTIPSMTSKIQKPIPSELEEESKLNEVDVDSSDFLQEYMNQSTGEKKCEEYPDASLEKVRNLPKSTDLLEELVENSTTSLANKAIDGHDVCVLKNLNETTLSASNDVMDNTELMQEFVMIPTVGPKSTGGKANKNTLTIGKNMLTVFEPNSETRTKTLDFSTLAVEETSRTAAMLSLIPTENSNFEESLDETYAMSRRVLMSNFMNVTHCTAFAEPQQVEITLPLKKRRKVSEFQDEQETNSNATATLTEEEDEDETMTEPTIIERNSYSNASKAVSINNGDSQTLIKLELPKANDTESNKDLETITTNETPTNPLSHPSSATTPKPILLPTNSSPPQNKQVQIVAPQIKELIKPIETNSNNNNNDNTQVFITPLAESYPAEPMLSIANFENLVHLQRYLDTLVTSTHISKVIDAALAVTHIFQKFSEQNSHSTLITTIEKLLSSQTAAATTDDGHSGARDNGKLLLKIHLEGSISILVDNNNVSEWMKLPPATAALLTKAAKSLSKWEKYKQQHQKGQKHPKVIAAPSSRIDDDDDEDDQILEIRSHDLINKMLPGQRQESLPKKENILFDMQLAEIRIKQQQQQGQQRKDTPGVGLACYKDSQSAAFKPTGASFCNSLSASSSIASNLSQTSNIAPNFKDFQTVAVAPMEPLQSLKTEIGAQTLHANIPSTDLDTVARYECTPASGVNVAVATSNVQPNIAQHNFLDQHVSKVIDSHKIFNSSEQNKIAPHKSIDSEFADMNSGYYDINKTSCVLASSNDFLTASKQMTQYATVNRSFMNTNTSNRALSANELLKQAANQLNTSKFLRHNRTGKRQNVENVASGAADVARTHELVQKQNDLFQQRFSSGNNFCAIGQQQQQQQQRHIASSYQDVFQHSHTYVQSANLANIQQQLQYSTQSHSPSIAETTAEVAETIDISQLKLPYTKAIGDYKNDGTQDDSKRELQQQQQQQQQHQHHQQEQQRQRVLAVAQERSQLEKMMQQRNQMLQQQHQQREFEEQQRRTAAEYEAMLLLKSNKEANQHQQRLNQHQQRYLQQQQLEYEKLQKKAKKDYEELQRKKMQYEWLQEMTVRQQQQQQQEQQQQQQQQQPQLQFQQQLAPSLIASHVETTMMPAEKRRCLKETLPNSLTLNLITDMNKTAKYIAECEGQMTTTTPPKRNRGRPRKNPVAAEKPTVAKVIKRSVPSTRSRGRSSRGNGGRNAAAAVKLNARTARAPLVSPTMNPPSSCAPNMLQYPTTKCIKTRANSTKMASTDYYNPYPVQFSKSVHFTTPQLSPKMSGPVASSASLETLAQTCLNIAPLSQKI